MTRVRGGGLGGYPVNLLVDGRRCVVVGGGRIAARKIDALLEAGAVVHVVAADLSPEVEAWRAADRITVAERPFEPADLDGAWLATTATDDPAVNRAVADAADARRIWCNAADDPANCSFTLMSVVRQGDLVVTIGTGGRSPALAAYLKDHVTEEMGPEWGELLELVADARDRVRGAGISSETIDWRRAFDSGMLDLIRAGRKAEAKELLEACLSSSSD
ncbi:MAG TPA: bifunctional precorrin-2 dehydrogenase/sirohydrochlorin ferrochelatase [Acidimicrobiia bacterium]|jgi:siroheme synthase-like protein